MDRRSPLLLGAALLLIALNLRLPLTAVPPVLDDIRAQLGLSSTASGLLTTLPILCFALAGPAAPGLARRFGDETVLLAGVLVLLAGTAIRIVPDVGPLFLGTLVMGVGIALTNILLPITIRRDFSRPGLMLGLYTMMLGAGATLGAGLTVPAEHAFGDWRWALAAWGVLVAVAAVLWLPATLAARRTEAIEPHPARVTLWRDPVAWQLTAVMALQSTLFYATAAWIPDILRDAGLSSATAGAMLAVFALLGLPTNLVVPSIAARVRDQRLLALATAAMWAAGMLGLLLSPGHLTVVWMVALGLGQGAGIALTLTMILLRAPDAGHASALSGMVQSGGYLVAAAGPLLVGALHDLTGGWTVPLLGLLGCAVALGAFGVAAGRARFVRGRVGGTAQWAY
jgi:CP family cyanate transporter-like MFS transporter